MKPGGERAAVGGGSGVAVFGGVLGRRKGGMRKGKGEVGEEWGKGRVKVKEIRSEETDRQGLSSNDTDNDNNNNKK